MAEKRKTSACSTCGQEIVVTKAGAGTLVCCDLPMQEKKAGAAKGSPESSSGFDEVIRFAVQREEEAAESYGKMVRLSQSQSARKLLLELQEEEKRHKKILLGLTPKRVKASGENVQDLKISDYLLDEPLVPDMSFQDLLIYAAKKEKKAVDLYSCLAHKTASEERKKLWQFLAKQELSHKLRLELEYDKEILWED